ncbi:hypothetical protein [Fischerella sp. PCC 9605]|uniref:hypothetical protein n=1 Tax=Fischerella sp. PCC 9605 TaxID=1173024 RepID=UPI00047B563D|nr:hypothetical protein [Fischerella sp. PCC 9605]
MSTQRNTGWDLAVYNHDGQLVLVIEIKSKLNAPPEWAAQLRRNILAHGIFPKAPYFLMVFPDRFYLWANDDAQLDLSKPTYTIDARPILQPYLKQAGIDTEQKISSQSLELIITSWLGSIIHSEKPISEIGKSQRWLVDSGLYNAIAGGRFDHEAVA